MPFPFSYWGIGGLPDNRRFLVIHTKWYVTNASGSGAPARLLSARLLEPKGEPVGPPAVFLTTKVIGRGRQPVAQARDGSLRVEQSYDEIPEGGTRELAIVFNIHMVPKSKKPIPVRIVVQDQFAKEHRLKRILVSPIPSVEKTDAGKP
jgi:hypothetical protein